MRKRFNWNLAAYFLYWYSKNPVYLFNVLIAQKLGLPVIFMKYLARISTKNSSF